MKKEFEIDKDNIVEGQILALGEVCRKLLEVCRQAGYSDEDLHKMKKELLVAMQKHSFAQPGTNDILVKTFAVNVTLIAFDHAEANP